MMQRALIIGHSGAIGAAVAARLAAGGVLVLGLSRSTHGLDLRDEASIAALLGAVTGEFDLILVATGGLEIGPHRPEKSLRQSRRQETLPEFL